MQTTLYRGDAACPGSQNLHGYGAASESVHSFLIFITEKDEGHGGPRRNIVLQHLELTERIIGLEI